MAKELRSQFAEIIENYIKDNLFSDDGSSERAGFKRKREQLEYLKTEEEIRCMAQTRILTACAELERCRDPSRHNLDEKTSVIMQDSLLKSIINTSFMSGLITVTEYPRISIASVAKELGYKPTTTDAKRIGLDLRKRYIEKHGSPPTKHDQLCDGRVTQVNSYTEQDRSLMEEALHAYFKPDEEEEGGD
jgi:hypothetical protein